MPTYSWACSSSPIFVYISALVFPRALPCVLTFSLTGIFVCDSDLRLRSLVFGVDFFLSADLAFGMNNSHHEWTSTIMKPTGAANGQRPGILNLPNRSPHDQEKTPRSQIRPG